MNPRGGESARTSSPSGAENMGHTASHAAGGWGCCSQEPGLSITRALLRASVTERVRSVQGQSQAWVRMREMAVPSTQQMGWKGGSRCGKQSGSFLTSYPESPSDNCTPRNLSQRTEHIRPHKCLCMNICGSITHHSQKVGKKQPKLPPPDEQINKIRCVHTTVSHIRE